MAYASKSAIERKLEALENEFAQKVEELAETVRITKVLPLCKKYGLVFLSGNGTFAFFSEAGKSDEPIGNAFEAKRLRRSYMVPVLEILEIEVQERFQLGMWVRDVTRADLEDSEKPR